MKSGLKILRIARGGTLAALTLLAPLAGACTDSESDGTGGGETTSSDAASSSTGVPLDPRYACVEQNLVDARPLSGPSFDPAQGGLIGPTQASYVVSTTQIYVPDEKASAFLASAGQIMAQLASTDGLVAYAVANDAGCHVYRTLSVWESQEQMYAFAGSGAHATAIAKTPDLSDTGRVVHWMATADEVDALDWSVARSKLEPVPVSAVYP